MHHITAIAPVYNEEANVQELVDRLAASLKKVSENYGLILVDDGSADGTWAKIVTASETEPRLKGLRLSRNFGQHTAITAGLDAADAEWVIVLDGDLQDRPEVIPELYAKAGEGNDVVFVAREDRPESRIYQFAQKIFYTALRTLTGTDYNPAHGNFSIISRSVLERYKEISEGQRFYGGLIEWLGFRRATLSAQHGVRFAGDTSYNFLRRLRFAKNIIVSFSNRPLYAALAMGTIVTLFSFCFGIVILFRALFFGYSVEGWPSLMVSIYFLGGVQMLMIGMNGLYIGRVSEEVKRRPLYVLSETAGGQNGDPLENS
jgi:dolichol-phosphate mannosyltransferase